jgi:WD40 repeat protein
MLPPVSYAVPTLITLLVAPPAPPREAEPVFLASLKPEDPVSGLRFSADGRTLTGVVRTKRKVVRWDLETGKPRTLLEVPNDGSVLREAYSPDGRLLVTEWAESRENRMCVRVWDLEAGKETAAYRGRDLLSPALSPDGKLLAVIEFLEPLKEGRRVIRLLDAATGKEVFALDDWEGRVYGLRFSPDGKTLAISGANSEWERDGDSVKFKRERTEVRLWDVAARRVRATLTGSVGLMHVLFSPDGKTVATWASNEHGPATEKKVELKLWDAATGREKADLKGHRQTIYSAAFSPDGKILAAGTGSLNLAPLLGPAGAPARPPAGTELKLWDVEKGTERADLSGHEHPIYILAFSPDGRVLASSWGNPYVRRGELRLWDVAAGKRLPAPAWDADAIGSLAFSPDGKTLAVAEGKGPDLKKDGGESTGWVKLFRLSP